MTVHGRVSYIVERDGRVFVDAMALDTMLREQADAYRAKGNDEAALTLGEVTDILAAIIRRDRWTIINADI